MPYLHCPQCHRTAWVRAQHTQPVECRRCGRALDLAAAGDVGYLTTAVRERLRRDARSGGAARRPPQPRA
jgi:ribosomal protein S27E